MTAPAPMNPELVIRKVAPTITTFSVPFARLGVMPFGGRSTAITLRDQSVWLLASHPLCPETLSTLKDLGPVKHLIAPDREHTMYLKQYAETYPDAKVYVPLGTYQAWEKKGIMSGRIGWVFGKDEGDPFVETTGGEIKSVDFGKAHGNEDVAFYHEPTKTLIEADLLLCLPPTEQYSKSKARATLPILSNMLKPGTLSHQRMLWYLIGKDRVEMAKQAKLVSAWDFNRLIPCHGDVIEGPEATKAWDATYQWFLKKE